jgi:hypothetical protein
MWLAVSLSAWLCNARGLACHWQTHLPYTTADNTYLLNQAHVQYQSGTGGSTVEKPAETLRLAEVGKMTIYYLIPLHKPSTRHVGDIVYILKKFRIERLHFFP